MIDDEKVSGRCCVPHRKLHHQSVDQECVTACDPKDQISAPLCLETTTVGGNRFSMGSAQSPHPQDGEGPVRSVWVDQFAIATTAVSNRQFKHFIDETGYKTEAEHAGSSFVFNLLLDEAMVAPVIEVAPWWRDVTHASWCSPEGAGSSLEGRWDHPVVHVTHTDALQYCRWSGTRLPTEAEWEYAARGGLESQPYPWGTELQPNGVHCCNIWQGGFPELNTLSDGYLGTAPVKEYSANGYGLYNMTGNVWEWVADRFTNMHSPSEARNPAGPLNGSRFVSKGGSYLCHESYCFRYRTSSRQALAVSDSAGNLGFRVAMDAPEC